MTSLYLGTIGFSYKDWVGAFYPPGTTQQGYLPYYCKVFNSVEIDSTFHSIPRTAMVQSWASSTPSEFKFCLKTPRIITHELLLRNCQGLMEEFIDSIQPLVEKLGPILIQLPPGYSQENIAILTEFLGSLPLGYQYAIEFRHPSWYNDATFHLLSQYRIGWVSIDYPNLPRQFNLTANFMYIRWIGINNKYHYHSYEREDKNSELNWWLHAISSYSDQVPAIYGFFNNDYTGFAAGTCKRFKIMAGLMDEESDTPYQQRLF